MINKKMYVRLSKLAIATMIASSLNVAVYAKDGDLWKANSNLGGIGNVLLHNRPAVFDLIKNTSTYEYEVANKLYNADQVNNLFNEKPTETSVEIEASVVSTLTSTAPVPIITANVSTADELKTALANNIITTINLTASFAASTTVTRPLTMNFGAYTLTGNLSFNYTGVGTSILTGDAGNRITGNLTVNIPNASFKNGVKVSGEVNVVNVEIGTWTESAEGNNMTRMEQL
ncbi:MAG: hypothetical protein ACI8WT_001930 [Clostridium sp.]|jgi:hypothetical protein